ncbi:MAG: TIGR01777 family oxidoreductase [Bacteroidales bacterium]
MIIIITGITGLIGSNLAHRLKEKHTIIGLTRNPQKHKESFSGIDLHYWDGKSSQHWGHLLRDNYAIINLAGEPIAKKPWSRSQKAKIIESRIHSVEAIYEAITKSSTKPAVVIQGSATGFYGQDKHHTFTENDDPGTGFLAHTTTLWEQTAEKISSLGVRMPVIRTGIVLAKEGGALKPLLKPFDFFLGGHIGSGQQWMSWIHLEDHIRAIQFLLEHSKANGPYNLTAPNPVQMKKLTKTAGKILNRPAWTSMPAFLIEALMGQMASEMLTNGARVLPERLLNQGFEFKYDNINTALTNLLQELQ